MWTNVLDDFCEETFWNTNLTWYTNTPDFSNCFQRTVLVWVNCAALWLLLPMEILHFVNYQNNSIPWTYLNTSKIVFGSALAFTSSMDLSYFIYQGDGFTVNTQASTIQLATYILVVFLTYCQRIYGRQSSGVQLLFWFLSAVAQTITCRSYLLKVFREQVVEDHILFTLRILQLVLTLFMFAMSFIKDGMPQYIKCDKTTLQNVNESPEETATVFSRWTISWMNSTIWSGWKKPLDFCDIFDLSDDLRCETLSKDIEKYLKPNEKPLSRYKEGDSVDDDFSDESSENLSSPKIRIGKALALAFVGLFLKSASIKLLSDILSFFGPELLRFMIDFATSDEPLWKGVLYASLMFFIGTLQTVFECYSAMLCDKLGIKMRSSVMHTLYEKIMCLSFYARQKLTTGEILNAMSVDATRFDFFTKQLNEIWSAPFRIVVFLYLLWREIGVASLAAIIVIVLCIPLNTFLSKRMKDLQHQVMRVKDKRIKMMYEVLTGVRVLKLYGWEPSFQQMVERLRKEEMELLKKQAYFKALMRTMWFLSPTLIAIFCFTAFVLADEKNVLTATTAFVSVRIFNLLRRPLNDLPNLYNTFIITNVSITRINRILNSDDFLSYSSASGDNKTAIDINDASFRWTKEGKPTLRNISLRVPKGSLVAVVGEIGAGKSSLLSAILSELEKLDGQVKVLGTIAYVSQQPWIQNLTLKDNILFLDKINVDRYKSLIEACALLDDIQILPAADDTEIGEKGINLSGGQKQRVSLARAVYKNSDVYLLDDPLGAVDAHVGKHIFDKVIGPNGLLKDKTRILVTHSTTFLPQVDMLYLMKDGEIVQKGTYDDLVNKEGTFQDFVLKHSNPKTLSSDSRPEPKLNVKISVEVQNEKGSKVVEKKSRITTVEQLYTGSTSRLVYNQYLKAIGLVWCVLILVGIVGNQSFTLGNTYWLALWTEDGVNDASSQKSRLIGLGLLGLGQGINMFLVIIVLAFSTLKASNLLHSQMLRSVLSSPISFFDATPIGRIINRFSKDIEALDKDLPDSISGCIGGILELTMNVFAIVVGIPAFLLVAVTLAFAYAGLQRLHLATKRQLKRMISIASSPLYSHFSETLAGVTFLRASGATPTFLLHAQKLINRSMASTLMMRLTHRWLFLRVSTLGNLLLFFTGLLTVFAKGNLTPGVIGFLLTQATNVNRVLSRMLNQITELETNVVAVERIYEYSHLKSEAAWETTDFDLSPIWPENGEITFREYSTRYREELDFVLKGLSFTVKPMEKIGVVGRTGAGKSSLTLAIFRLIEPASGAIVIDGVNISKLGLSDLRSRLTIIPQDPVLFAGTLRINIDPLNRHSDHELWSVLEESHLKKHMASFNNGLSYEITEGGSNLSVGQRQLICLARALLRRTKILILDEATASVDLDTDNLIQSTIRKEFSSCTVITIAHRLNTVMDYDRVMVLDQGEITEFDDPRNLINNKESVFYGMAKDAGIIQ